MAENTSYQLQVHKVSDNLRHLLLHSNYKKFHQSYKARAIYASVVNVGISFCNVFIDWDLVFAGTVSQSASNDKLVEKRSSRSTIRIVSDILVGDTGKRYKQYTQFVLYIFLLLKLSLQNVSMRVQVFLLWKTELS